MASGAEVGLLGNNTVLTNPNSINAIKHHIIPHPSMIVDGHLPGIGKAGRGANVNPLANGGPKEAQQGAAEAMGGMVAEGKGDGLHEPPAQDR